MAAGSRLPTPTTNPEAHPQAASAASHSSDGSSLPAGAAAASAALSAEQEARAVKQVERRSEKRADATAVMAKALRKNLGEDRCVARGAGRKVLKATKGMDDMSFLEHLIEHKEKEGMVFGPDLSLVQAALKIAQLDPILVAETADIEGLITPMHRIN